MSLHLVLKKPVTVRSRVISEITLRDVVAADVFELGLPMLILSPDESFKALEFRPKVLAAFIARLAGIPVEVVKCMAMNDLGRCQAFIFSFLVEE